MNDQHRNDALCSWIRRQLKEGIRAGDDILYYVEATFGTRDLESVLADSDSSEVESLLELLFYPDHGMQLLFESDWGREIIHGQDQQAVIETLCAAPPTARVVVPGTKHKFVIPVPGFVLQTFVQRLSMCWQPPEALAHAVDRHCQPEKGVAVRVRLRNARLAWHRGHIGLLERYLSHVPDQSDNFDADLDFLISMASELSVDQDHFEFLIGKKLFYFRSLCSAEDFERKRQVTNMETMMMQGVRFVHGSIDEWRRYMRQIDRICQALFGRTQFFKQPERHTVDIQNHRFMQDVIDKLS